MRPKKTNSSFLYLAVLLLLLSVGITLFVRSDFFAIREIKPAGLVNIQADDITQLSSGVIGQNLLLFDAAELARKIKLHPLVKDVDFQRQLPHTLVIKVTERTPVALVAVTNGVIEVDSEGVFLRRLEEWQGDYPVISGVKVPDTAGPGQSLQDKGLIVALTLLGQAPKALVPLIGEINVNTVQQADLFLTSGIEVKLGHTDNWGGKLTTLMELINDKDFQAVQNRVRYIDFTAAKPVIGQ